MNDRLFYDQSRGKYQSDRVAWRDNCHSVGEIPPPVRRWLLDESSLTRHLQQASLQSFAVQVLRQEWASPLAHERRVLDLGVREAAQLRETLLLVDKVPWVFARSVIPAATLTGSNRCLRRLGNQSLGSWLFQTPSLRRSRFQFARINPGNELVPAALQGQRPLWGRRSRFEVRGKPLLVCEIFLPDFRPWPETGGQFARRILR